MSFSHFDDLRLFSSGQWPIRGSPIPQIPVTLSCTRLLSCFFLYLFYREDCSTPAREWDKHNARYCYCCYYDAYDEDDDDDEDNNFYNFILIFIVVIVIVIVIFIVIVKVPISSKLLFPHLILNFMQ